jgi:PAS domain S-box-containing protein
MWNGGIAGLWVDISKLKEIETQLRRTTEYLDRVQRIAGIGSTTMDLTSGRFEWSAGARKIFGIEPADIEPTVEYFRSFVHPVDRAKVKAAAEQAQREGVPAPPLEYRIVRPDGSVRTVYRENDVERNSQGDAVRRIVTFKDITEFKATEMRLRETMEHLERIQRIAGIGSMMVELATGIIEWSVGVCAIFGVDRDAVEPTPEYILSFIHQDDRAIVKDAAERVLAEAVPAPPLEYRIIRPDGTVRTVYRENDIQCDPDGHPIYRVLTFKDITELKANEARLRQIKANLDRAQRLSHTGSFFQDLADGQIEWSDETYRIFGVDRNHFALTTENFLNLVVAENRAQLISSRLEAAEGTCPAPFEYRIRRPSGEIRHIHRITELVRDGSGAVIGMAGSIHDVTELRAAEARQKELERQLLHSQKLEALGTLAGGVAHDLNNTLLPILMLARLLLDDLPTTSPISEDVETILRAGERARDLVKQIVAFSRKQEIRKAEVDPAVTVMQALGMLRATLPSNIAIIERVVAVPPILADAGQLQQVVVNLITNAAHAIGDAEGSITVEVSVAEPTKSIGDYVQFRIADTGCGMDQAVLDRIFEPFFTTKGVGEGTGLGLSVVHGIITGHGGTIDAQSEPGVGSVFTILLPISEPAALPLRAAAA